MDHVAGCVLDRLVLAGANRGEDAARNMVHETERIEPRPDVHEAYQFYFEKYMETYPRLSDLSHDLVDHLA